MSHNICLQSELTNTDISKVQLLRTGTFTDMFGRDVSIDDGTLQTLQRNFNNNMRGIENKTGLPVDFSHLSGEKAAGWIRRVEFRRAMQQLPVMEEVEEEVQDGVFIKRMRRVLQDDGSPLLTDQETGQLWVDIQWTPGAERQIQDGEFKFISAEFAQDMDGTGAVLFGAGVTNRPAVDFQQPIKFSKGNPQESEDKTLAEQLKESLNQHKEDVMSEKKVDNSVAAEQVTLAETQRKAAEAQVKLAAVNAQLEEKQAALVALQAEEEKRQKEAKFAALLSEHKAVPAQKEAFMKGDVVAFAEAAVELNLSASGTGQEPKQHADSAEALFTEYEAKVAELRKEGVELGEAYTQVLKSDPKYAALASIQASAGQPA